MCNCLAYKNQIIKPNLFGFLLSLSYQIIIAAKKSLQIKTQRRHLNEIIALCKYANSKIYRQLKSVIREKQIIIKQPWLSLAEKSYYSLKIRCFASGVTVRKTRPT